MTTQAKVESNRQNALLSTGPHNTESTRHNAVKHGLRAKKCFRSEDSAWIEGMQETLEREFNADTTIKKFLVRRLAVSMWKLNRAVEEAEVSRRSTYNSGVKSDARDSVFGGVFVDFAKNHEDLDKECPRYVPIGGQDELWLRYETAAENTFYRTLDKLRELGSR